MQNTNTKFTNKSKKTLALAVAFRKYIFCIGNLATHTPSPPVVGCFPKILCFRNFLKNGIENLVVMTPADM